MQMYELFLKNGHIYVISEKEHQGILASKGGLILIESQGVSIDKTMVSDIRPYGMKTKDLLQERARMTEGYLHTGERAVKQFGMWVDPNGQRDENGRYITRFDASYYPEVAADCVAPLDQWEEIKHLPRAERLTAMMATGRPWKLNDGGAQKIGEILNKNAGISRKQLAA